MANGCHILWMQNPSRNQALLPTDVLSRGRYPLVIYASSGVVTGVQTASCAVAASTRKRAPSKLSHASSHLCRLAVPRLPRAAPPSDTTSQNAPLPDQRSRGHQAKLSLLHRPPCVQYSSQAQRRANTLETSALRLSGSPTTSATSVPRARPQWRQRTDSGPWTTR
jgi:hypothetical protein